MPQAFTYPGVYIVEAPSQVHTIVGVPTAITAFVGAAARGPVNTPTAVQSPAAYARVFGGDGTLPLDRAITLFFQNGGGDAIVVRVGAASGPNAPTLASAVIGGNTLNAASPGAWGNQIAYQIDQNGLADPLYNLTITFSGQPQTTEIYSRVSTDPTSPRSLARLIASSSLVTMGAPPPSPAEGPAPVSVASKMVTSKPVPFSGGNKTDPAVGEADLLASIPMVASNNTFFNLLVLTPVGGATDVAPTTLAAAAAFAKDHRAMLIADAPAGMTTVDLAVAGRDTFFNPFGDARDNAAVYFPRLELSDPNGVTIPDVGPSAAVAGLYATTDNARGVWKAPAGIAVQLAGVSDLAIRMSDFDNGRLNPLAVNCLRSLPVVGDVVWGARTMNGDDLSSSQWKYIPVRRLALFIEESLFRGTQWVVFEPNDEPLWAQVRLDIGAFMHGLFRQGAFAGQTAKDAYFVQCDSNTNPQADIDNGILNVIVGFAPLKPAEFVVVTIQQIVGDIQT
jgi:phage tail sheath protein FI